MKHLQKLRPLLANPAVVMFGVSLLLLLVSLVFTHKLRSYTSDDVTWQKILLNWHPFSGEKITLGSSDNFVDKLPFFALLGWLLPAGRKLLLLQSTILACGGFALFYLSSIYFLKKTRVKLTYATLLPFAWLASFGYSFAQLYLNPIWRGFEVGVSFATFAVVAMVLNRDINPLKSVSTKILTLLSTAVVGLMIYSDPYYLYFTLVPIALLVTVARIAKKITSQQVLLIISCLLLSFGFAKLTGVVSESAGIFMATDYPTEFIKFEKLPANIWTALHGILVAYGADFSGLKLESFLAAIAGLNLTLLLFIVYKVWNLRDILSQKVSSVGLSGFWTVFFGLMIPFVFLVYVLSSLAHISTYRYFFILVFASILFLALSIGTLRRGKKVIVGLLILATAGNIGISLSNTTGFLQPGNAQNLRNDLNYRLIETAKAEGLTKGYANFWQGVINSYLSRETVEFLPSICDAGITKEFHWLIDEASFKRNINSTKTFFLSDPDIDEPPTCTRAQLEKQFGKPVKAISVANKTMYIYNYDIGSRIRRP